MIFSRGVGRSTEDADATAGVGTGGWGVVGAIKIVEGSIEDKPQETKIHEHSFLLSDLSEPIEPRWTSNGDLFLAPIA